MKLAKVIGTVVSTRKEDSLTGYKLMIVKRIDTDGKYIEEAEVAADYVGAGVGEIVLTGAGSSVRVDKKRSDVPIDMAIIGIVDTIDI